jgi:hypothetical protein
VTHGARLRRATRRDVVGVDVAGALNLVGALLAYLSFTLLVPATIALVLLCVGPFVVGTLLITRVMIALMWMGRLELVPVVVLLTRRSWRA